jgi:hypothetical protein
MVDFPFSVWYTYIVRYFVSPTNRNLAEVYYAGTMGRI